MTTTTVKNAHCVKLCRSLWELQQSGQLCDLSLRVGNAVITAHRTVLATSAAFFLQGKSAHADGNYTSTTINVSETTAASVQDIVRFVYTGVLTVNTENVDGIYSLCEKWNINSAKSLCEKFMSVHRHKSTKADCERPNTRQLRNKSVSAAVVAAEQILPQLQCVEDNLSSEEALRLEPDGKEAGYVEEAGGEPCRKRAKKQTVGPFTLQKGRIKGRPAGTNNKPGRGGPKKMVREQAEDDEDTGDTEEVINDVPPVKWRLLRKCAKCREQFESVEDLAFHKSSCSASNAVRPYRIRKCRKCKRVFGSVEECRLHLEQCSEGAEEGMEEPADVDTTTTINTTTLRFRPKRVYRKCHRCHQVFDTPEELLMHKVECRTANIAKPYAIRKCRKCKKTFGTSEDCAVHQLECTASALKPPPEHFKYKCDNCGKAFTKKRTLDSHMLTKHWSGDTPGPEYFFCKIEGCKFKTLYPYYMQKHIHWTHAKDKAIMCDVCGAMSKNEYYLKAHKRIRHSEAEVFDCDVCGMKIRTQQSLKMHRIRVHGVEQPTKLCSHCTYITYTKSELDRHMFQKHDTPFPSGKAMLTCPYCDYKTITKSVIDEHVLRHTADKREFPCDQCRKRFITERDLRSHLKVHNPERKRYKCPHCDYSTPYGQYKLRTHVETMHEKKDYKPWVCKICNYRTNIKGNLTLHLKNTHKLRIETKTRMINKVEQLCSTGSEPGKAGSPSPEGSDRPGEPAAAQAVRPKQSPAEQVASLLPEQVSMLVQQRPEEHLERQQQKKQQQQQQHQQLQHQQHQQQHQQQQQQQQQQKKQQQLQQQQVAEHAPQLPYCETPALLSLTLPTERVAFKHMTSTTEETKLYKLHPVSDVPTMGLEGGASISNQGLEQLSLHTMVPAGGGHLSAGHHHQGNAELDFNMAPPPPPARMLGPTDVSGAQTMYMDTLINSLVSRSDHPL